MRSLGLLLWSCLIGLGFGAASWAQQGAPTLAATLQFIQDKTTNQEAVMERFDFGNTTGLSPDDRKQVLTVAGDPATCELKITVSYMDHTQEVLRMAASFRDVLRVTVTPRGDGSILQFRGEGTPFKLSSEFDFDPSGRRLKAPRVHEDNVSAFSFRFRDPDMAKRVANAAQHAVDLCGGGVSKAKREPF